MLPLPQKWLTNSFSPKFPQTQTLIIMRTMGILSYKYNNVIKFAYTCRLGQIRLVVGPKEGVQVEKVIRGIES